MSAEEIFMPRALRYKPDVLRDLVTFKITSPLFYAQIARWTTISEYIEIALSKSDRGTNTFHTSHPDLLVKLFQESSSVFNLHKTWPRHKAPSRDNLAVRPNECHPSPAFQQKPSTWTPMQATTSPLNSLRWTPIHLLRSLRSSPSHPSPLSGLDASAVHLSITDAPKVRGYRKAVVKMLVSDYVAFGMPALVDAALWAVRVWLCWRCVLSFDGLVALCNGPTQLSISETGKVVMGCLGVHLWWALGEVL